MLKILKNQDHAKNIKEPDNNNGDIFPFNNNNDELASYTF
jgi:hypothetical protein